MDTPETRFARIGDERIAYQVYGEGPDLVYFAGMASAVDVRWEQPALATFHRRLGAFCRVIGFDRRGTGASDVLPAGRRSTWETFVDDLEAVLDAVGSEAAFIFGALDAGPTAILYAASHPERTSGLILGNTTARLVRADDYPQGLPAEIADGLLRAWEESWGTEALATLAVPSRADDPTFTRWYAKFQRAGARPRDAVGYLHDLLNLDVRGALSSVRVPALVLHSSRIPGLPVEQGRYLADALGARFVELDSADAPVWTEHPDLVLAEIEEFVTGARRSSAVDRVLATVMFTDIAESTERAMELGDHRWRELVRRHEEISEAAVAAFRGRLVKSMGDGILATFDGPARAVRCAGDIRARMKELGLELYIGLHTGEIELLKNDIGGVGVNIAARVMAEAEPNEILTTGTVRDLVVGSEIGFSDRGARALRGIPGEWRLFEAIV